MGCVASEGQAFRFEPIKSDSGSISVISLPMVVV